MICRSGFPIEVSDQEMCKEMETMIIQDHHINVTVLVHELETSVDTAFDSYEKLLMSQVISNFFTQIRKDLKVALKILSFFLSRMQTFCFVE